MPICEDLTGRVFTRLTVLGRVENDRHNNPQWLCQCECGNRVIVLGSSLRTGRTKSCKCLTSEWTTKYNTTHGGCGTRLHKIFQHMMSRCHGSKNSPDWKNYGGRGIIVEPPLDDFPCFRDYAYKTGYDENNKDLTIERIDVNDNYRIGNITWVPKCEQSKNRRAPISQFTGERTNVQGTARKLGISANSLRNRLRAGVPFDVAVSELVNAQL